MSTNAARVSVAIDKVYKTCFTQDQPLDLNDQKDMKGLSERVIVQYVKPKFQQQLQRVRCAFQEEFANHSVVAESEVRKIRDELSEKLEEKYSEKMNTLRRQAAAYSSLIMTHQDEICHLKGVAESQAVSLSAVRQRLGLEQRDQLKAEIQSLKKELEKFKCKNVDLSHKVSGLDNLVAELRSGELALSEELARKKENAAEAKRTHEEEIRSLRQEMDEQRERFECHLNAHNQYFIEYKEKTSAQLLAQEILNTRRSEALTSMEEERERYLNARVKQSPRSRPLKEMPCELVPCARYRVDEMGMDVSWREYKLGDSQFSLPLTRAKPPRMRKISTCRGLKNVTQPDFLL